VLGVSLFFENAAAVEAHDRSNPFGSLLGISRTFLSMDVRVALDTHSTESISSRGFLTDVRPLPYCACTLV
jgi:hypothetical protein